MRDSDWSRENLLCSDWLVLQGATITTQLHFFRHLNEHGYKFSMITTRTSSHVILLLEEKGVRLLSLSLLSSKDLY